MTDDDTRRVEQAPRIGARPETAWQCWPDRRHRCDWWSATAELDPRPGGVRGVEMGRGPVMVGEYVELVLHERIVFTFVGSPPWAPHVAPVPAAFADEHHGGESHLLPLLVSAARKASS